MEKLELSIEKNQSYFVGEAFKTLRTNIQFCGTDVKVIELTSCDANEGKTTIATLLSKSLSEIDKKVLLIDCDMRKSVMVTRYTKNKNTKGLSEYLSGLVEQEDIIYPTQFDNFNIVLSGPGTPNPVELISSKRFSDFINQMKLEYDYIIIDTPPLGLVIDSAVIAGYCDSAIIVTAVGKIKYKYAQNMKAQLEKSGCRILGVVLNHVVRRSDRYYKKYYTKYYGKGYYSNAEQGSK